MSTESFINPQFSDEKIRLTLLTNICRMMIRRGHMDPEKYKKHTEEDNKKNTNDNMMKPKVDPPSIHDPYDNDLFLPFIENRSDNNVYIIPIDNPFRDEREAAVDGGNLEFDGSSLIVKLIPQVVKDISNSPILNDFLKSFSNNHKIVVFDGYADKVYNIIRKKKNIEVFDRTYLMIDLMSKVDAPLGCTIIDKDDIKHIINPRYGRMHENDPTAKYYNARTGSFLRIERASINNSKDIGYSKIKE